MYGPCIVKPPPLRAVIRSPPPLPLLRIGKYSQAPPPDKEGRSGSGGGGGGGKKPILSPPLGLGPPFAQKQKIST